MSTHRVTLIGGPFDGRVQFLLVPVPRIMMCDHRPRLGEGAVFHHYVQTAGDAGLYAFERTDETTLVSSPPGDWAKAFTGKVRPG